MSAEITFLGAAGTVTGSRFHLRVKGENYLIDCGLFQGGRKLDVKNWLPFPIGQSEINAVFLTHAHIDHVGYLPRLVSHGFQGPIYATQATCALLELLLPDAAYLQEQEAAYANKTGYSRHKPALPLFTSEDAEAALELLRSVLFHDPLSVGPLEVTWRPSGHILGAGIIETNVENGSNSRTVVFSGDLGRYQSEIMKSPVSVPEADVLLIESTYGDRLHEDDAIEGHLSELLRTVSKTRGVLLIPAFAVGRTQQILYWIRRLQDRGLAPDLPVFIDSPMAVEASYIYCRYGNDHNLDINLLMDEHECPLRCRDTHFITAVADSKELNTRPGPAVIISASGMCTGGRILHHLKWRLPDSNNIVLFIGYQASGTRGRRLLDGVDSIRIHGQDVPVRAKIAKLDALSAHADKDELVRWAAGFLDEPSQVFIVHGEPKASRALQKDLREKLGWRARIPSENQTVSLLGG